MSMNIAVTGLNAATTDLNVISDNIANVNTTGFKSSRAEFGDMVNSAYNANGMGVLLEKTTQNFGQGSIATTGKDLDLAISGTGFFQLKTSDGDTVYSRAGAFTKSSAMGLNPLDPNDTGTGYSYLVNNQSQYLLGYGTVVSDPIATTKIKFDDLVLNQNASSPSATFSASDASSYNYATSLTTYDSEGVNHELQTFFRRVNTTTTLNTTNITINNSAAMPATKIAWNIYSLLDGKLSPSGQTLPPLTTSVVADTFTPANGQPSMTLVFDGAVGASQNPVGYITYTINSTTGSVVGTYVANTDVNQSLVFDLGRNATLSPSVRFTATSIGNSFISGIGTVADGSAATRSIAGAPDQLLRIDLSSMASKKTDTVGVSLNLASVQPRTEASSLLKYDITLENKSGLLVAPSANFSTSMLIYDGQGSSHTLKTVFKSVNVTAPVPPAATSTATIPATTDTNTWNVTYYLLDSNGVQRQVYDGGVWTFSDVNKPTFQGTLSGAAGTTFTPSSTGIKSIAFSSNDLGTGAPGFVATVSLDDVKIINPPSTSAKSNVNRLLATSLTADPAPINGQPPSMDPSIPANYNFTTATTVYDSLGNSHTMNLYFRKVADNNWTVYAQLPDVSTLANKIGSLTFDTTGNLLAVRDAFGFVNPDPAKAELMNILDIRFPNGSTPQNIAIDISKVTQFDSKSVTNSITQNGYKDGILNNVSVDAEGKIIAKYDNDKSQEMGQIALARFTNRDGLKRVGDNNWVQTSDSGEPVLRTPGTGSGKLVINALESSNVDLTQQLVSMISAQRNFQANAQVITTNSTLYQSILGATR